MANVRRGGRWGKRENKRCAESGRTSDSRSVRGGRLGTGSGSIKRARDHTAKKGGLEKGEDARRGSRPTGEGYRGRDGKKQRLFYPPRI